MHRWTQSKHRKCVMGRTNCSFTQPTIVHCFDVGHLHCQPLSDLVFLEVYLACVVFQTLRWQVHNAVTWSGIKAKCESFSHGLSCSSNWRGRIHKEIVHSRQTVGELQKTPRQWSLPRIRLYFVLVLFNKTNKHVHHTWYLHWAVLPRLANELNWQENLHTQTLATPEPINFASRCVQSRSRADTTVHTLYVMHCMWGKWW